MSWCARPIPLFPLPSCVVLPGALQALHIFEQRYRDMIADEYDQPGDQRFIAIALLCANYESQYYTHHAPIHPVVCVGRIVRIEFRPDGRSDVLLLGRSRATILSEQYDRGYRRGRLKLLESVNDLLPAEEARLRQDVARLLRSLPPDLSNIAGQIVCHQPGLEQAVDLLAYHLLAPDAVPAKQLILSEPRVDQRVKMLMTLLRRRHFKAPPVIAGRDRIPPTSAN